MSRYLFIPNDNYAGHANTVDNFIPRRYYIHSICPVCNNLLLHNPYIDKDFSRITHQSCARKNRIKNKRKNK